MSDLAYVVVSDLHLGAAYSLLTDCDVDGNARPTQPSPLLRRLADAMRQTLQAAGGKPPTLVLLGDVFDLAFSSPHDVMAAFEQFIAALFDPAQPAVFATTMLYVPGNHDHRHWQIIRDEMDLAALQRTPGPTMPPTAVITDLFADSLPECQVATALARRATGNHDLVVESGYPNVGFRADDRWVVFHHGHYTESTYRAISSLMPIFGGNPVVDAFTLELMNGPWIDFLWSSIGGQGWAGAELFNLYETMQDAAATHDAVKKIATRLLQTASGMLPVRSDATISTHGYTISIRGIVEGLLDITLARFAQSERSDGKSVLSADGIEGVLWYLSNAVRAQLTDAGWTNNAAHDVRFVFGHTHKPFQDQIIVPGYTRPVQLWNTGGWVLDQPSLSPAQGAAAVVIDSDANVASIRLFNDPVDGGVGDVRVAGCNGIDPAHNPLLARLEAAVKAAEPSWKAFSATCMPELEKRSRFIRGRFFDAAADPPIVSHTVPEGSS